MKIEKPLTIVHVIPSLRVGGAETMLSNILDRNVGNNHVVICFITMGSIGERLQDKGFQIHVLGVKGIFSFPGAFIRLVKAIKKYNPDIVQTWMYHSNLIGGLAARLSGNKNVVWGIRTTDAIGVKSSKVSKFIRLLNAWASHWLPSNIICVAEAARESHIKAGYSPLKISIIPNGFDIERLRIDPIVRENYRISNGVESSDLVLGSLGRFHVEKDHHTFIIACDILLREYKQLRILLVGRGLDKNNLQLLEWINATGSPDRFILMGETADVVPCLSAMDIFCLHSRNEGFPNVLGEAMAMGLPCVATNVGDSSVLMGESDFLVDKEDPEALANGIMRMIEVGQSNRLQLGKKGARRIKSEFPIDHVVKMFDNLYLSLS